MNVTNLVSMQPTHTSLDFRGIDTLNIVAFFVLDKYASKETNHVGAVQKDVGFFKRHALVQCASKMIDPNSVLSTHVLFLSIFLLFTSKEQALCKNGSVTSYQQNDEDTY